jgi:hypothetical protein
VLLIQHVGGIEDTMSRTMGFGELSSAGSLEPQFAARCSFGAAPYLRDRPDPVLNGVVLSGIDSAYLA